MFYVYKSTPDKRVMEILKCNLNYIFLYYDNIVGVN